MSSNRDRLSIAAFLTLTASVLLVTYLWRPQPAFPLASAALALLLPILYLLIRSGREDLDSVLLWLAGACFSAALVFGVYILTAYRPGPEPKKTVLLTAVAGLATLAWTLIRQYGPESSEFPDLLAGLEPHGKRYETNRVRYDVTVEPGDETHPHHLRVTLQNCCDARRRVGFGVRGPILRNLRYAIPTNFELGPAEVWQARLPVVTMEKPGATGVTLVIAVVGHGGRRVRLRRSWMNLRGTSRPAGVVHLRLQPLPAAQWTSELSAPAPTLLWPPQAGTLEPPH